MKPTIYSAVFFTAAMCFACLFCTALYATEISVPAFADWKLNGNGKLVESGILQITGNGKDTGNWTSPPIKLSPNQTYRFSVEMQGVDTSGGCLPCGLSGFSRDYIAEKGVWQTQTFCFIVPDQKNADQKSDVTEMQLKVGQWESTGTFQFRNVKLETVMPVLKQTVSTKAISITDSITELSSQGHHKTVLTLGEGEMIQNNVYTFNAQYNGENSIIHRPLHSFKCGFNSNRWTFGEGNEVTYQFDNFYADLFANQPKGTMLGREPFPYDNATLTVNVNYLTAGEGVIEISKDGETRWTEVLRFNDVGTKSCTLLPIAFPLERFFVRISGLQNANFQIDGFQLESLLGDETETLNAHGETLFATSTGSIPEIADAIYLSDNQIAVNTAEGYKHFPLQKSPSPGKITQTIELEGRSYTLQTETHPLERSDYGYHLESGNNTVWWAEADWKISRTRKAPEQTTKKPLEIAAAKNDTEAFQIVIRADEKKPIEKLTAKVSMLKNQDGNIFPAENIEILYAYYHFVHSKTDGTGLIGDWPDALPPLNQPLDIPAGKNQPIWFNVKVPSDIPAGSYTGTVGFSSAKGLTTFNVPITVKVWNFALPKENHHETAYGFSEGLAFQYHNAKTEDDKRRVLEMYLQLLSDYRISIYRPTPLDYFSVRWLPDDKDGEKSRCEIDFTRFDAEMSRVLEKFHFTNFTVPGHGLGGGTFHARDEPMIGKYGADTPQYKAMMSSYYTQLVQHLKEKGWLDKAYVYWFDEPAEKDYEFVAQGTARLQQYAPDLNRMMTLMMSNTGFLDALDKEKTSVNIWCSISNHFVEDLAAQRRAKGERFWWYICTGPKAPYCTLFIDHPATELRVWHWQAWQRKVVGSLIWQSNYWTSGAAFPNSFQNPYEDPMGYVSGYSTPSGTKAKWGNGDGRFIYPPLSAPVPGLRGGKPNFDKPVASIRWAMIREGIEDYEMFYLLQELLKQKSVQLSESERKEMESLLTVPESITKTMTEFTIDPRPLLEHRRNVAAAIEILTNR